MKVFLRRLSRDYAQAMKEQQRAYQSVWEQVVAKQKEPEGYLFIGEHDPVYTLGKNGNVANLLVREGRDGIPTLYHTDRGGDITYHGPGQIVVYFVVYLPAWNLGVRRYVQLLEQSVMTTLAEFQIASQVLEDAPGVWLSSLSVPALRKICALGIHVNRGITTHGIALNVTTDLAYFTYINPCGFTDRGVTSLEQELQRHIEVGVVEEALLRNLAKTFQFIYAE